MTHSSPTINLSVAPTIDNTLVEAERQAHLPLIINPSTINPSIMRVIDDALDAYVRSIRFYPPPASPQSSALPERWLERAVAEAAHMLCRYPPSADGLRTPDEAARKLRKPTLASVAKAASKAGIKVARYEIKPDGTVVVVTGTPTPIEANPWDEILIDAADKKRPS